MNWIANFVKTHSHPISSISSVLHAPPAHLTDVHRFMCHSAPGWCALSPWCLVHLRALSRLPPLVRTWPPVQKREGARSHARGRRPSSLFHVGKKMAAGKEGLAYGRRSGDGQRHGGEGLHALMENLASGGIQESSGWNFRSVVALRTWLIRVIHIIIFGSFSLSFSWYLELGFFYLF
jgi:hypothetical protein